MMMRAFETLGTFWYSVAMLRRLCYPFQIHDHPSLVASFGSDGMV